MIKREIKPHEGRKITNIISEIHTKHFEFVHVYTETSQRKEYAYGRCRGLLTAPSSNEDNEEYDKQFIIFRNILVNRLRAKYKEKLPSIDSFVRLATIKKNIYDDGYLILGRTLNLAEYLNIIEKNESWIEYLLYLVDYGRENNGCVIFDPIELDEFCLKRFYLDIKYLSYIVDIKKIEYRDRYLYSEPKRLQDLDNLWRDEKYDEVIDECRNSFLTFVDKYRKERGDPRGINVEKKEKPKLFKKFFAEICCDYKIEILSDYLVKIFWLLGEIRNEFGKGQPGASLDEKEIQIINKKVNTRMLIDFTKVAHNLLSLLVSERKRS